MVEVLFVHGALVRDGAWWWRRVAELVEERVGVRSRAVDLPSCGEGAAPGAAGLAEDAAALRAALDASGGADGSGGEGGAGGAVVVGHSYGGTVIAEGADHPAVRSLVLISSYLPEPGLAQAQIMGGEADPVRIEPGDDGTVRVAGYGPDEFGARFWQDVADEGVRAEAWQRLTAQSAAAFGTPTTRAAWRGRPSTYLVCTEDRSTSVGLHAARATRSFDLPTGHHPMLSRPDLVADLLIEAVLP